MATLLLVDGVSWSNQQAAGASAFLSSLHRSDLPLPPCIWDRHYEPSMAATTTRCASSYNNLIDSLDPPLPRFPNHQRSLKGSEVSRYRVYLDNKPKWNLLYVDESETRSKEPSLLNESWNNLEQPSSPGNGDASNKVTPFIDGQEFDMKRSQRISPSYMSISRSQRAMSNGTTSQLVPTHLQYKSFKGSSGLYVGFAAIVLGLVAILQKGGLLGMNSSTTIVCSTCDGYGMRPCKLCKGRGSVTWEGKLKHTDLCPSCFGSRFRKCYDCGGYRMRSDEPPFLQQVLKSWSSKARP